MDAKSIAVYPVALYGKNRQFLHEINANLYVTLVQGRLPMEKKMGDELFCGTRKEREIKKSELIN